MRFKNTSHLPDRFLRRLMAWCAKEIGLPLKSLRAATFTRTRGGCRGRAWWSRRILIRVSDPGRESYPYEWKYPRRVNAPVETITDQTEEVVHVVAHELQHVLDFSSGITRNREAAVDGVALAVLRSFRTRRAALLERWEAKPPTRPEKPKRSKQEARAESVESRLKEWRRKLKLAQTKVKLYTRKKKYYDRVAAAKPAR